MSASIGFFGTRDDLSSALLTVEAETELEYVECVSTDYASVPRFASAVEIPGLGTSASGNHLVPAYLVIPRGSELHIQKIAQRSGVTKYVLDQMGNLGTVVLHPGGVFEGKCVVAGHLGTVHRDDKSRKLFRALSAALKQRFAKVGAYWVGREALSLQQSGLRLVTIDAREPSEYDLAES